jgi:hypothetical protein
MYTLPDEKILIETYDRAPKEVQEKLSSGEVLDFISSLQTKQRLHVDTVGTITAMTRDLILGLIQPTKFFQDLNELVNQPTAEEITRDLNEKVFKPIRKAEEAASEAPKILVPVPAPLGTTPPTAMPIVPTPAPTTILTHFTQPTVSVNLPGSNVPVPMSAQPAAQPQQDPVAATPSRPILQSYGVDPYREPPE